MRRIAVTDKPGVGKSTVVAKAAGKIVDKFGLKIRGIWTSEIRKEGRKIGFSIEDLATVKTGILSHIKESGPRVEKYHVNLKTLPE